MTIPAIFDYAKPFVDGFASVASISGNTWKYGFIDRAGNYLVQPKFDYTDHFHNGMAAIRVGNKWGYIDSTGAISIEPRFENVSDFVREPIGLQ
jgi:hypothetical protein